MERPLFTRILTEHSSAFSEMAVQGALAHIIERTAQRVQQKGFKQRQVALLTRQFMGTEFQTVGQAFASDPRKVSMPEDEFLCNRVHEPKRPMSAKINHYRRKPTEELSISTHKQRKSQYRGTNTTLRSTKQLSSSNLVQTSKKYRFQKENVQKYFPVPNKVDTEESLADQKAIAQMRLQKTQQSQFQKAKAKFFKTIASEEQRSSKINKRFIQLMGNKPFYYNSRGQAVEMIEQRPKLSKKTITHKFLPTTTSTKRLLPTNKKLMTDKKVDSIYVDFQSKQNAYRSSQQTQMLDEKAHLLFIKSTNCNYKVVS